MTDDQANLLYKSMMKDRKTYLTIITRIKKSNGLIVLGY